jgi:DNA-binding MarR family transcriptional regulator
MATLFFEPSLLKSREPDAEPDTEIDARRTVIAQWLYWSRQIRPGEELQSLYGEPVWDLLLDLYINEKSGKTISVSSLCFGTGVPNTTGLRYLAALEKSGWISRTPDPADRRRVWINLLPGALAEMDGYVDRLATMWNVGPDRPGLPDLKRIEDIANANNDQATAA